VRKDKLQQHDIPDLLVVSDMQFNEAIDDHSHISSRTLAHFLPHTFGGNGYSAMGHVSGHDGSNGWESAYEKIQQLFHTVGLEVHGRSLEVKFVLSGEMEEEVVVGVDAEGNAIKETKQLDP